MNLWYSTKRPMWQEFKRTFRRLAPLELASYELAEAELSRLDAQTAVEFSQSIVDYRTKQIDRLRAFISDLTLRENATDTKRLESK